MAAAVAAELPELPKENIIGEPAIRDTANAICLAAAVRTLSTPTSNPAPRDSKPIPITVREALNASA